MSKPLRLFVGIGVGDAWTARLQTTTDRLRVPLGSAARWVRPELYHVTVVFLGNQPSSAVPIIGDALAETAAGGAPFTLRLTGIKRLGGHERGALVAAIADASGRLRSYRTLLDAALQARGIAFDSKPLVPHVTLARPRGRGGLPSVPSPDLSGAPPLPVARIDLVQSDLLTGGPVYTTLLSAALA
jgi:2'-5' RNA ligase